MSVRMLANLADGCATMAKKAGSFRSSQYPQYMSYLLRKQLVMFRGKQKIRLSATIAVRR